jgi:pyoverdine/dityrosine biosynthesis protein Dit1
MALTFENLHALQTVSLETDQEAALLLLMLTACAKGTSADPTAAPFLELIKKFPDPTALSAADVQALRPGEPEALKALSLVFANSGGRAFYTFLNRFRQADSALADVQASLTNAARTISGIANVWAEDPPHPKGQAVGSMKF